MTQLHRITARHFVAGAVSRSGYVEHSAPILAYARGWSTERLTSYAHYKGWEHQMLRDPLAPDQAP